eukprot:TRINITY_DN9651_c0_g1_i10.p3 TRINITY_DN9651_c0_g1~~TRINITY_DN9651_c0_g1_i10.p3  ORF type:complete len:108 (+),score=18.89 TRINITY_DN9651_c0_g1_i10:24-347(+)
MLKTWLICILPLLSGSAQAIEPLIEVEDGAMVVRANADKRVLFKLEQNGTVVQTVDIGLLGAKMVREKRAIKCTESYHVAQQLSMETMLRSYQLSTNEKLDQVSQYG